MYTDEAVDSNDFSGTASLFIDTEGPTTSLIAPAALGAVVADEKTIVRRNNLISKMLPLLVYSLSNAIIFITRGSLSMSEIVNDAIQYFETIPPFGSWLPPALVVLINDAPLNSTWDYRETTNKWLSHVQEKDWLKRMFSSVAVFKIPYETVVQPKGKFAQFVVLDDSTKESKLVMAQQFLAIKV